jgi:hypothetical protein
MSIHDEGHPSNRRLLDVDKIFDTTAIRPHESSSSPLVVDVIVTY